MLTRWVMKAGELVRPLISLLRDRLLAYDIVAMDETRPQAIKEPGEKLRATCRLTAMRRTG